MKKKTTTTKDVYTYTSECVDMKMTSAARAKVSADTLKTIYKLTDKQKDSIELFLKDYYKATDNCNLNCNKIKIGCCENIRNKYKSFKKTLSDILPKNQKDELFSIYSAVGSDPKYSDCRYKGLFFSVVRTYVGQEPVKVFFLSYTDSE